jgi:hypothetical protein
MPEAGTCGAPREEIAPDSEKAAVMVVWGNICLRIAVPYLGHISFCTCRCFVNYVTLSSGYNGSYNIFIQEDCTRCNIFPITVTNKMVSNDDIVSM